MTDFMGNPIKYKGKEIKTSEELKNIDSENVLIIGPTELKKVLDKIECDTKANDRIISNNSTKASYFDASFLVFLKHFANGYDISEKYNMDEYHLALVPSVPVMEEIFKFFKPVIEINNKKYMVEFELLALDVRSYQINYFDTNKDEETKTIELTVKNREIGIPIVCYLHSNLELNRFFHNGLGNSGSWEYYKKLMIDTINKNFVGIEKNCDAIRVDGYFNKHEIDYILEQILYLENWEYSKTTLGEIVSLISYHFVPVIDYKSRN